MIPKLIRSYTQDVAITLYGHHDSVFQALATLNAVTGLSVAAATGTEVDDQILKVQAELRFVPASSVEFGELLVRNG